MVRRKARFAEHLDSLSYGAILGLWFVNILIFASIYVLLSRVPGNGPAAASDLHPIQSFWDILYFSIITATSTGYGDIVPVGLSRAFAAIESFSGILLFALFVSKLLSRRQDIALTEIHELAFQTAFHNMREDLYTARKDLDLGIHALEQGRLLGGNEWEQISVALQQIGHLMHEIPTYYEHENELYTIDQRREKLLIEAVERTLARVLNFIGTLDSNGAVLEARARDSLSGMLEEAHYVVPNWMKHSFRGDGAALRKITTVLEKISAAAKH